MIGDPTGTVARNFDVMIEEAGLALRGTFVVNLEGVYQRLPRSTIWASAAMLPERCCASQAAQYVARTGRSAPRQWTGRCRHL